MIMSAPGAAAADPDPDQIRAWQGAIRIHTRAIERILAWHRAGQCSDVFLFVYGGRRMAAVVQLADRLQAAGAPLWPERPAEGARA